VRRVAAFLYELERTEDSVLWGTPEKGDDKK
jgi:hypothetical protein